MSKFTLTEIIVMISQNVIIIYKIREIFLQKIGVGYSSMVGSDMYAKMLCQNST